MNDRHHGAEHGRLVREVRDTARWVIRAARLGSHRYVEVCLHWRPCRDGRRDADNPSATAKVVFDAAVDEGLVPGDEPRHMRKLMPRLVMHLVRLKLAKNYKRRYAKTVYMLRRAGIS